MEQFFTRDYHGSPFVFYLALLAGELLLILSFILYLPFAIPAMKSIFTTLFKRNPIQRIFRFLDEATPWGEDLHLLASLPPLLFVQALYNLKVARKL